METKSKTSIPIAKPQFSGNESALIQQAIESGWVSMGPLTKQFEDLIAAYTGSPFAIAMNSCTSALHIAMLIHGIGLGADVICPSYSFIATANSIAHAGATPQFVDIDAATLNLSPDAVKQFIEQNYNAEGAHKETDNILKAILLVHQIGIPCDIDAFQKIADDYGIVIIEDAACALGSFYNSQPIGSSGNTSALSFHPRKIITTGEGGMLLVHDDTLAEKARALRAHGASVSDLKRHQSTTTTYESYDVIGYNYRLTDMQAALGITQMEQLEVFIEQRVEVARQYDEAFSKIEALEIIRTPDYVSRWNKQSYPLRLKNATAETRDTVMQKLETMGVTTRRGIPPIHLESAYFQNGFHLPVTEAVSQASFFLPIYPSLTQADIDQVILGLREALEP